MHDGQERKGDGLPYIVHPFTVALIVMEYTKNEDIIAAALLHDTLEDTSYPRKKMEKDFGKKVTDIVEEVTELPKHSNNWLERKNAYLEHLKSASPEASLICAADKLHNLQAMTDALNKFGKKALAKFNAPADKKTWFYDECVKVLKSRKIVPEKLTKLLDAKIRNLRDTLKIR